MNYYLVKRTQWFFDGHGDEYYGGTDAFVSTQDIYSLFDPHKYYSKFDDTYVTHGTDVEAIKDLEIDMVKYIGDANGELNSIYNYDVIAITKDGAYKARKKITAYNKLLEI